MQNPSGGNPLREFAHAVVVLVVAAAPALSRARILVFWRRVCPRPVASPVTTGSDIWDPTFNRARANLKLL
jgi:hypothetical protein